MGRSRRKGNKRNGRNRDKRMTQGNMIHEVGTQIISSLNTTASSGGAFNGNGVFLVRPATLGGRISLQAGLYSRYRIRRLRLVYIPRVGSTVNGAIAVGVFDDTTTSTDLASIADYPSVTQLRCTLNTPVWRSASLNYTPVDRSKWYYTDEDSTAGNDIDRFTTQLTIVAQFTGTMVNANAATGDLKLYYDLEFAGNQPFIQPTAVQHTSTQQGVHSPMAAVPRRK